jgi:hypothetical protein
MVRDNRHDSAYLFGAICHARKVGAAIIMPSVNAEAMSEHLKEISTQIALGAHALPLLKKESAYSQYDFVVKAGWVSNVAEKYRRDVATACAAALVEAMDAAAAKKTQ